MIDKNPMAHVILTVSQFNKSHKFYSGLLPEFGMTMVNDGPDFFTAWVLARLLACDAATLSLRVNASSNIG